MTRAVLYDVTRLSTRISRPAPNGIDRVDLGYASHFLYPESPGLGVFFNGLGSPRAIPSKTASRIVSGVAEHWRETHYAANDPVFRDLSGKLGIKINQKAETETVTVASNSQRARGSLLAFAKSNQIFGSMGLFPGADLVKTAPKDAVYLNVSQFPLWLDWYFHWLDKRPDVKALFFLHDLLPIDYPEFFPAAEEQRHQRRLEVLVRRADAVIVASEPTADRLARYCREANVTKPRIEVVPLPVDKAFKTADTSQSKKPSRPFFVTVGTIEPRKNHLLLLSIWRNLVDELGDATPTLVMVGARGWEHENVADLLERCERLNGIILEAQGLSTPGLIKLINQARAVLVPSWAEGFGLPVSEALACGAPVVASALPVFEREHEKNLTLLDPLDGPAWQQAVRAHTAADFSARTPRHLLKKTADDGWMWHCNHIEDLIADL